MSLDYNAAQESFNDVLCKLHPWVLSNFIMWLDLKIAEYKVFGEIVTDKEKINTTCLDNRTWSAIQRSRERLRETQKSHVQTRQNVINSEPPPCQSSSEENTSNNGDSSLQNVSKFNDYVKERPVQSSNNKLKRETEQCHVNIDNEHHVSPQKRIPQILSSSSERRCRINVYENRENSQNRYEDGRQKHFETSENIQKQSKIHKQKETSNHVQTELINLDTDEDSKDDDEFCNGLGDVSMTNSVDDMELADIDQQFKDHIHCQDQNSAVKSDDGCGSCVKLQSQVDSLQNWMKKLEGSLFSKPDTTKASSSISQTTTAESPRDQRSERRLSVWQSVDARSVLTEPLTSSRQEDTVLTDEEQTDINFVSSKRNVLAKKNKLSQSYNSDTTKPPRAGVLTQKLAAKWQMVELQTGSSVYIHYQQWINAVAKDPTKAACYLMSCFWKKEDLKGMTLTGVRNSRRLNPEIVHTIINFCLSKPGGSGKLAEIKRAMRNKIGDSTRVRSVFQSQQRTSSQVQPSVTNGLSATPTDNMSPWPQSQGSTNIFPQSETYCISTNEDSSQGVGTHCWSQDDDQGTQPQQTMYLHEEDVNITVKHEPSQDYL